MAGFTLPKLRWLVIGAAAAGIWAMTQDVPPRGSVPKQPQREASAKPAPERVAKARDLKPVRRELAALDMPQKIVPPAPKPSDMTTSSIPRPEKPVNTAGAGAKLFATSRVRLREKANTSASVVLTLDRGQPVTRLAREGKWHLVSVSGEKGWVHGDFLSGERPTERALEIVAAPRPKVPVTKAPNKAVAAQKMAESKPVKSEPEPRQSVAKRGIFGRLKPAREPRGGNCQCPYDLMLSGKQCGDHSAYARNGGGPECYL